MVMYSDCKMSLVVNKKRHKRHLQRVTQNFRRHFTLVHIRGLYAHSASSRDNSVKSLKLGGINT